MKFKMFSLKISYLIIALIIGLLSCQKKDTTHLEKKIAVQIVEYIINKDTILKYKYSREVFLHITSQKLGKNHYKSYIVLNGLQPNFNNFKTEKLKIKGIETIIYYSTDNSDFNLPNPFFVPDSKHWEFLIETLDNEIMMNKLEPVYIYGESNSVQIDELDF